MKLFCHTMPETRLHVVFRILQLHQPIPISIVNTYNYSINWMIHLN